MLFKRFKHVASAMERSAAVGKPSQKPIDPHAAIPNSVGIKTQTDLRQIESVSVHDLRPGGNEVVYKLLLVVILGIDLGIGA